MVFKLKQSQTKIGLKVLVKMNLNKLFEWLAKQFIKAYIDEVEQSRIF
jgi:hypothetical protein